MQSNQSDNVARLRAPVPRKKVTVSLTVAQAEMLRALWQEHSAALHAMLTGWCGDAQSASDMLQEVFRRLAESPAVMTRMKNAQAFLAVSARRIAVDFARRSNTRSAYQTAAGAEVPTAENPGPTDENLRAVIAEALNGLPAEQRSVFEHKILNGRTLDEISKLEGISLNTVASRLRYALDKIRGQLRPYYDDLNRKDFKDMKNDPSKSDQLLNKRIITPLEPKRVPSVVPGFEGLAAMPADGNYADLAPNCGAPAAELVEPEIAFCGVGGNAWEASLPETVELPVTDVEGSVSEGAENVAEFVVSEEMPEMISCEILPEGGIPEEWLRPIVCELPEDFFVTVFEGDTGHETGGVDPIPFDWNSGFELCVLPPIGVGGNAWEFEIVVAGNLDHETDASVAGHTDDPTSHDGNPEPITFEMLPVDPADVAPLEHVDPTIDVTWETTDLSPEDLMATVFEGDTGHETGGVDPIPFDWNSGFELCVLPPMPDFTHESVDPHSLFADYQSFLSDNPDWIEHNQGGDIQAQVITSSGYFSDLEFGTPGEAASFDHWFETHYGQNSDSADGGTLLVGSDPHDHGTEISHGTDTNGDVVFITKDGSFNPDGIEPTWRGGTDQPSIAHNMSGGITAIPGNGTGLSLSGPGSSGGDHTHTDHADANAFTLSNGSAMELSGPGSSGGDHTHADHADANAFTLSNGSAMELQGGKVVSDANVYHFDPNASHTNLADHAESTANSLPVEITTSEASGMAEAHSYGDVATGLAPTPGAALIVEFSVLSPSEQLQSHAPESHVDQSVAHNVEIDVPHLAAADAGHEHAYTDSHQDASASDASSDAPQHFAAAEHHDVSPAAQAAHKVDAPTVAAGAVAAGTVVQAGGVAPSVRRPLPKI